MKVAFDYDDCLDFKEVFEYASELVARGIDVYICTARMDNHLGNPNWNTDVFDCGSRLLLPNGRIILTNGSEKSYFLTGKDFIWLLDDMKGNISDLEENSDCIPILYSPHNDWKDQCENLLSNKV